MVAAVKGLRSMQPGKRGDALSDLAKSARDDVRARPNLAGQGHDALFPRRWMAFHHLGRVRPDGPIAETALMALRAVPVPTYVTNTVADHAHILRNSGVRVAIVSARALAGVLREAGRLVGRTRSAGGDRRATYWDD